MNPSERAPIEHGPKRFTVERLDQYLRHWEDLMKVLTYLSKIPQTEFLGLGHKPLPNILAQPNGLRKHLLRIENIEQFDFESFCALPGVFRDVITKGNNSSFELGRSESFPLHLANWITQSRRVYHLDEDLELSLAATSLDGVRWSDLSLPFDSFGISLERPFKSTSGKDEYDFILVSRLKNPQNALCFSMFSSRLKDVHPVSRIKLKMYARAIQNGNKEKMLKFGKEIYQDYEYQISIKNPEEQLINNSIPNVENGDALRLAAGVLLYLSTFSREQQKDRNVISPWQKILKTRTLPDSNAITNESEICTVHSTRLLSSQEREVFRRAIINREPGYQVSAHFRAGHWRRPPGTAQNLDQEKTVWVRPTLVRRDRLLDAAVPGGSEVKLK